MPDWVWFVLLLLYYYLLLIFIASVLIKLAEIRFMTKSWGYTLYRIASINSILVSSIRMFLGLLVCGKNPEDIFVQSKEYESCKTT